MTSPINNNDPVVQNETTLKELISRSCKRVEIGCAVLPKPLLDPDVDEDEFDGASSRSREGVAPEPPELAELSTYMR